MPEPKRVEKVRSRWYRPRLVALAVVATTIFKEGCLFDVLSLQDWHQTVVLSITSEAAERVLALALLIWTIPSGKPSGLGNGWEKSVGRLRTSNNFVPSSPNTNSSATNISPDADDVNQTASFSLPADGTLAARGPVKVTPWTACGSTPPFGEVNSPRTDQRRRKSSVAGNSGFTSMGGTDLRSGVWPMG